MSTCMLVIDGGTTNVRITLHSSLGEALCVYKKEAGVAHTAIDGHNGRIRDAVREGFNELLNRHGYSASSVTNCVAYGMITSREGLLEIPHCVAPVDAAGLHKAMVQKTFPEIAPFPIRFIPGVRNFNGAVGLDNFSQMDMMRGEETEAIGLWRLLNAKDPCVMVLPGSHNKFVKMDASGAILNCMTTMSGEFLSALSHHTILSGAVGRAFLAEEEYDRETVLAGYLEAERAGLNRAAFAGRILSTLGKLPPGRVAGYLLGAVLQADARALTAYAKKDTHLILAGKQPVKRALYDVLTANGFTDILAVPDDICARMGVTGAMHIAGIAD